MDEFLFLPQRRIGLFFHAGAILLFLAVAGIGLWQATQAVMGPIFLFYLLISLSSVLVIPLLAYRAYALRSAFYSLERDGIRLRWGLRFEDIPMPAVMWVHPASNLSSSLPLPWLRWPGAVLGTRRLAGTGTLEFLAASSKNMILVATPDRVYAISPADVEGFLQAYQRLTEMGSLSPLPERSIYPTLLLRQVWETRAARYLLLGSLGLSLILLVWVSLAIPSRQQVYLGYDPSGFSGDAVPSLRLLLLPVINTFFVLADLFMGLFFFRREESQPFSYLLWGSGVLTSLLFLVAVFSILRLS
jgi:hypothetical protein